MASLEELSPPRDRFERIDQTVLAWRLSGIARKNAVMKREHPQAAYDFRSPLSARRRLQQLTQQSLDGDLTTHVICSRARYGDVQGLANVELRSPRLGDNGHSAAAEISYWHLGFIDSIAKSVGKDIVRQAAQHAMDHFMLDPTDGAWMLVMKDDEVKHEVCTEVGLLPVILPESQTDSIMGPPDRILYVGHIGLVASYKST